MSSRALNLQTISLAELRSELQKTRNARELIGNRILEIIAIKQTLENQIAQNTEFIEERTRMGNRAAVEYKTSSRGAKEQRLNNLRNNENELLNLDTRLANQEQRYLQRETELEFEELMASLPRRRQEAEEMEERAIKEAQTLLARYNPRVENENESKNKNPGCLRRVFGTCLNRLTKKKNDKGKKKEGGSYRRNNKSMKSRRRH